MEEKFSLEAAGRFFGISANAMRARVKKNPDKYRSERDNRGQIWVWLDPAALPSLKLSKQGAVKADAVSLKASLLDLRTRIEALSESGDLRDKVSALEAALSAATVRAAAAEALAEERSKSLEAARRNLEDLRRLLPPEPAKLSARRWWSFWK